MCINSLVLEKFKSNPKLKGWRNEVKDVHGETKSRREAPCSAALLLIFLFSSLSVFPCQYTLRDRIYTLVQIHSPRFSSIKRVPAIVDHDVHAVLVPDIKNVTWYTISLLLFCNLLAYRWDPHSYVCGPYV